MATGCDHQRLRLITTTEEPNVQERNRRPLTCEDCNYGDLPSRFTLAQGLELLLKERAHATSRRH